MVEIVIHNVYSQFTDYEQLPKKLRDSLEKFASFMVKGAQFSAPYKAGTWDGREYLLNKYGQVPTGLVGALIGICREAGYEVSVDNRIVLLPPVFSCEFNGEIRDYQQEAVDVCKLKQRGIVELPPRTGKTYFAAKLMQEFGVKTLFLVHGTDSLKQVIREVSSLLPGVEIGGIGGGRKDYDCPHVIFGLIESLSRVPHLDRKKYFGDVGMVMLDEVHRAGADNIFNFFMNVNAGLRYGFSGTTFRTDNRDIRMIAVTGRFIYRKAKKEMWDSGVILKPTVFFVQFGAKKLHRSMFFQHQYVAGIVNCEERNRVLGRILDKHSKDQILVSVENIEHGRILNEMYSDYGAVFVSGTSADREEILRRVVSGEIRVIIATKILNESLTFPDMAVIVNMSGKQSPVAIEQKVSRVQGHGDKDKVYVYDFVDSHGSYLEEHSNSRRRFLKKKGYDIIELDWR